MFEAWGRVLSRRRRLTLVITLLFVAFAGAWGTGVFGKLSSGDNFTPPSSPSQREASQAASSGGRLTIAPTSTIGPSTNKSAA